MRFVAYVIASHQKNTGDLATQEARITDYLRLHPEIELLDTFVELGNQNRNRHTWPVLKKTIQYCKKNQVNLLIAEIQHLANNEAFSDLLLALIEKNTLDNFTAEIICCDQPYITTANFPGIAAYMREQRKTHGELIKAGLAKTELKSGNPHASQLIAKINKPKIDHAITFALLLQPVIHSYQAKGYSQRKIVAALNEEGFLAPEGGKWVLSQLQKVLERIRLNELALALEKKIATFHTDKMNNQTIADALNAENVDNITHTPWTVDLVDALLLRIQQIQEILQFNALVIELMPILDKYHINELNEDIFALELNKLTMNSAALQYEQTTNLNQKNRQDIN